MRQKCKYRGHNDKTAAVSRPDGKTYEVTIPDKVKNKEVDWFEWMYPLEDVLTIQYYREVELDNLLNIKRDLCTYISGFRFYYDYIDGVVEVLDITSSSNFSCYDNIKGIFNLSDKSTHSKIVDKITDHLKLEVKEIRYMDVKYESDRIRIEV